MCDTSMLYYYYYNYSEEHILRYYKLCPHFTRGEAIFRYLEIVQSLPMYSYHYFEVKVCVLCYYFNYYNYLL